MAKDPHQKYRDEILKKYHLQNGGLIAGYPSPSIGDIKEACERLYLKNCDGEDEIFLKKFLGAKGEQILDNDFNVSSRFRNIQRFLIGEISKPHGFETIEVIAWLVNFTPRPLSDYLGLKREDQREGSKHTFPNNLEPILKGLHELKKIAESLKTDSWLNFGEEELTKILAKAVNRWGEQELKGLMAQVIDEKFIELERRLKKTISLNKKLGILGLIFLPTTKIENLKEIIFDDFLDRVEDIYQYKLIIEDNGDIYFEDKHTIEDDDPLDGLV